MNTLETRVAELEKLVEELRQARDIQFVESSRRRIFQDIIQAGVKDSNVSAVNKTSNIVAVPVGITTANTYNAKVRVRIDGTDYYIGLYNT